MQDVGIIYLCRFAEGEHPVRRFVQSYRDHVAGLDHDLHVIFKGFPDRRGLERSRALFAGIPINVIEQDDVGYDVGSYVAAAKTVSNHRLVFLNTFSQILGNDWLRHFDRALSLPKVGLVGATGSWQSKASGYEAALKRLCVRIRHLPAQLRRPVRRGIQNDRKSVMKMRRRSLRRYLLSPVDYLYYVVAVGRHPNPHIRTNAFMLDRSRFLSLDLPSFRKKGDAYSFESGRRSLTRQIIAQDLQPVVVGRNGDVYTIEQWNSSATFWNDDQVNLLVADNRTCDYAEGDQELREYLEDSAWARPFSWRTKANTSPGCD